jgi:predicted transcriptional regulator
MNEVISKSNGLDQPDVQAVINIAEELIRKNKLIQIDLLYKIAKRRLKLESETLLSIINLLLKKKILVEGSKLTKSSALLNQYRSEIFNFIKTYPGVHFSVIKRETIPEGSSGQFIWHINVLLKFYFIKEVKIKNYTLFIPTDMDDEFGTFFFLLRDKINLKIVKYLDKNEPFEVAQIPNKILESKGSVYYHIKTMKDYNVLYSKKNDITGNKEVWLNPEKKPLFIQIANNIETNKF